MIFGLVVSILAYIWSSNFKCGHQTHKIRIKAQRGASNLIDSLKQFMIEAYFELSIGTYIQLKKLDQDIDQITEWYTFLSLFFLCALPLYVFVRYYWLKTAGEETISADPILLGIRPNLDGHLSSY